MRRTCVLPAHYSCQGDNVVCLPCLRSRRAWRLAAEHLNAAGVAAAVPAEVAPYLLGLGLTVWTAEPAEAAS